MQEQSIMALIVVVSITMMFVCFSTTVAQGSMSFSCKPLGLHFEVKKGS
jgi:hypothetical protein